MEAIVKEPLGFSSIVREASSGGSTLKSIAPFQTVGLTPPKPLSHHHPTSRSMDSPQVRGGGAGSPAPVRPGLHGSQSDSEALSAGGDGTRLTPGRLFAVRRQASMEMGLGGGLRDNLQPSALPGSQVGGLASADFLPPSPSTTSSPSTRWIPHSSHSLTEGGGTNADSSALQAQNYASSSQTSSTSTTSASTSISSTTSISTLYGPPIRSFDYSALLTADDVHGELAKVVEDLATWLGIVETGLTAVLDSVGTTGVSKHGVGPDIAVSEGELEAIDDAFENSGTDVDEGPYAKNSDR